MGKITKFDISRLEQRNPELFLDCPNCGTARITLSYANGTGMDDAQCPKCSNRIILDTLNITVISEGMSSSNRKKQAKFTT